MGRFVARRLLQALPTVAGVVLVTFVLFNVVGGSPAAQVLGPFGRGGRRISVAARHPRLASRSLR